MLWSLSLLMTKVMGFVFLLSVRFFSTMGSSKHSSKIHQLIILGDEVEVSAVEV